MRINTAHSFIFVRRFLLLSLTVGYLGAGNQALALDPFECDDVVYQTLSAELRALDLSTGIYGTNLLSSSYAFGMINGAGYNEADNFIYAPDRNNSLFLRIDANGDAISLGSLSSYINAGDVYNDTFF